MNIKLSACALSALFALAACNPSKRVGKTEVRNLETVEVTAEKIDTSKSGKFVRAKYNASSAHINDLIHTKLDVRFDWEKQHLIGRATLVLRPYFYQTDSLRLDAKGFDIKKVSLLNKNSEIPLKYTYTDNNNLYIKLDRTYNKQEEYQVYIEYVAKPNELPVGGSAAITADKGLYFINPTGAEGDKPRQIWTQGETEASSKWFPTIDRPNERCTQEIYITVENKYRTLSNGLLKSSTANGDGSRTDYWVMDKPHAPYLFMMTVGEFATVQDEWNGMLLEYIVEPKFEAHAKAIYPYTGEMLTFFSNRFGVKYPWQKYSQVVVRDYVSGAMENTTAVIFGDFVQKTAREIADNPELNEGIVAHEMMHHWFGDLVTCESWSNLPLNESFANYSEYLWFEHKHGRDAADHHRLGEILGYLRQASMKNGNHPLIYFGYTDKEDMFDSHSYNKGGAILHMLRQYLGDEAFFESLRVYLEDNKYKSAEVHDLRLAFEKVTGKDLNWFFNQWFFTQGHPKLEISREYDASKKQLSVTVKQNQDYSKSTVFILPFHIDIYTAENQPATRHTVTMDQESQTFVFSTEKPLWTAVDASRDLLCERNEQQSTEEYIYQYKLGKTYVDRYAAINKIKDKQAQNAEAQKVIISALSDKFWDIRRAAVDALDKKAIDKNVIAKLSELASKDPRAQVREAAIQKLAELKDQSLLKVFSDAAEKDQSYMVNAAALEALFDVDEKSATQTAAKLENSEQSDLLMGVARVYIKSKDQSKASFFETRWKATEGYESYTFFGKYTDFLLAFKNDEFAVSKLPFLQGVASDTKNDTWQRYGAASAIKDLRDHFRDAPNSNAAYQKCAQIIEELKAKETDPMLSKAYKKW